MSPAHSLTETRAVPAPTTAPPTTREDVALLDRLARGERAALATIYDRHSVPAFSLAQRMCGPRAGDVVEESFLALWREARAGRGSGSVRSRVLRITHERALALRNDGERLGESAIGSRTSSGNSSLIGLSDCDARAALEALAPPERRCIEMAYFDGLGIAEIATRTGFPPAAVKDRMARAVGRLGRALEATAATPPSPREPTPFSQ